jgi:hypothetical protein
MNDTMGNLLGFSVVWIVLVVKLESDARTAVIQALGGAALLIGLYSTSKTLRTTQEGQITDRFTKAINQLGETGPAKLAIRLGGIYALERIARESERDHWPIMEILTAYVREHAPWLPKDARPLGGSTARDQTTGEESPPPTEACHRYSGHSNRPRTADPAL